MSEHTFVRKIHHLGATFFFPSAVTLTDIEEAVNHPNPRRALLKLADFAFNEQGFVVKNRYNGITAPFDRSVTRWECVKAFFKGYIDIR